MRCERCRRVFECVAGSTLRLCKACAIVAVVGIAAPHDLPHNHNESAPKFVRALTVVAASTASTSFTISDSGTITWRIPPRRPSG
jgi:hypothetical protein